MRFLLFFIISFTVLAQVPEWKEPDFSKVTMKDLEKYEADMLRFYKDRRPSEIQGKYLLASRYFSQNGEYQKALWLLKRGVNLTNPEISYLRDYFSLLQQSKLKTEINQLFEDIIIKEKFQKGDQDELAEILLVYLRTNNFLSTDIKEKFLVSALEKSVFKDQVRWSDSMSLARKKQFKEALEAIRKLKIIGEEDNTYVSWLQKKNKLLPKYCSKVQSFPDIKARSNYKVTCALIMSDEKNLEDKIKETNEILEHTPLHEVLY